MYKNILIPVSFDQDRDVDEAVEVANRLSSPDTKITFIHVAELIPNYVAEYIPPDVWENRQSTAKTKLAKLTSDLDNAHGVVVDGSAGRTITNWAEDNGCDLIVIASHRPAVSDIFLGSTAAWVVRHANCPVLVLR